MTPSWPGSRNPTGTGGTGATAAASTASTSTTSTANPTWQIDQLIREGLLSPWASSGFAATASSRSSATSTRNCSHHEVLHPRRVGGQRGRPYDLGPLVREPSTGAGHCPGADW